MKANQIRWLMDVMKYTLYTELAIAAIGFLLFGIAIVLKLSKAIVIYGIFLGGIGIITCYLSGVYYDRLNTSLRAAESEERSLKRKEEKQSRKKATGAK